LLLTWEDFHSEAEEYRELDYERILVLTRLSARDKTSGLELGGAGACVFHIRNGRVTRYVVYPDRENAFADLGLEE
jgi:ketosteroid isomerase-like protein